VFVDQNGARINSTGPSVSNTLQRRPPISSSLSRLVPPFRWGSERNPPDWKVRAGSFSSTTSSDLQYEEYARGLVCSVFSPPMVCVLCVFILEREGRRFVFLLGRPFSSEESKGSLAEVFATSSQIRNTPFHHWKSIQKVHKSFGTGTSCVLCTKYSRKLALRKSGFALQIALRLEVVWYSWKCSLGSQSLHEII
jgi:hypothetical protein